MNDWKVETSSRQHRFVEASSRAIQILPVEVTEA